MAIARTRLRAGFVLLIGVLISACAGPRAATTAPSASAALSATRPNVSDQTSSAAEPSAAPTPTQRSAASPAASQSAATASATRTIALLIDGQARTITIDAPAAMSDEQLRAQIEPLAAEVAQPPITGVISDADAITRTFTFTQQPGRALNLDAAVARLRAALDDPAAGSVTLETQPTAAQRPPIAQLNDVLAQHVDYWRGTAGLAVIDLQTGDTAGVNANTAFSGASVMKMPIMLYVYSRLGTLNDQQRRWMERMIFDSKNYEATRLLAATAGGDTMDEAFVAVTEMTAMLRNLGLKHTYMLVPYEGSTYLRREGKLPQPGPEREGDAPYTEADPYLRTTPAEIARLYAMLDQCAHGGGPLIEQYGDRLSAALCGEMIGWLQQPHDETRMKAGVPPEVKVAHKAGWTADMQADVGIVDSPGGRYVAAIFVFRPVSEGYVTGPTAKASPYLGDFSHTIYSFFNPEPR